MFYKCCRATRDSDSAATAGAGAATSVRGLQSPAGSINNVSITSVYNSSSHLIFILFERELCYVQYTD